jgi:hypothetical protein
MSELYRPSDRLLSAKLVPTFAHKGCHVASVTDPYYFLDRTFRLGEGKIFPLLKYVIKHYTVEVYWGVEV